MVIVTRRIRARINSITITPRDFELRLYGERKLILNCILVFAEKYYSAKYYFYYLFMDRPSKGFSTLSPWTITGAVVAGTPSAPSCSKDQEDHQRSTII